MTAKKLSSVAIAAVLTTGALIPAVSSLTQVHADDSADPGNGQQNFDSNSVDDTGGDKQNKKAEDHGTNANDNVTIADVSNAKADVNNKSQLFSEASNELADSKLIAENASKNSSDANDAVDSQSQVVNTKTADVRAKENAVATDAANEERAKQDYSNAINNVQDSQEYKTREAVKENAEKELAEKQSAQTAAETALKDATAALDKKNAEIAAAQKAVNDAQAKATADSTACTDAAQELADAQAELEELTDEKGELEEAQKDAQSAKDTADNVVATAQTDVDELNKQIAEMDSSLGYFRSLGEDGKYAAEKIEDAMKNPSYALYYLDPNSDETKKLIESGIIHPENSADATSLTNMLKSLDFLEKINQFRNSQGVPSLKVLPYLMASQQVESDARASSDLKFTNTDSYTDLGGAGWDSHQSQISTYWGNLALGAGNADEAFWKRIAHEQEYYDYIKTAFNKINASDLTLDERIQTAQHFGEDSVWLIQTFHYTELVDSKHDYAGISVLSNDDGIFVSQFFLNRQYWLDNLGEYESLPPEYSEDGMSVDEMRKSIQLYQASLDSRTQTAKAELADKQANLQKLFNKQNATDAQLVAATKAVLDMQNKFDEQVQAVADKQGNADRLAAIAAQSAKELSSKEIALNQMDNSGETQAVDSAASTLTKAKTDVTNAKQTLAEAENNLRTVVDDLKKAYDDAVAKATVSKKAFEDANSDLFKEISKLDDLKKAAEKAKENTDKANAAVSEKELAYQNALKALSTAKKTLEEIIGSYQAMLDASTIEYEGTNEDGSMMFETRADLDTFNAALVDGKVINEGTDYTLRSGSTELTLTKSFIGSLAEGVHTLTMISDHGTASYDFTVSRAKNVKDNSGNMVSDVKESNSTTPSKVVASKAVQAAQTGIDTSLAEYEIMLIASTAIASYSVFKLKNKHSR